MSQPGPVGRVASLLIDSGYVQLQSQIAIAGVPFNFDAVLVASERAYDLVVVVDTAMVSDNRLRQQVEALGRALDVAGSLRPISVVTVGPPPSADVLEVMSRIARVLVVSADGQAANVRDALAVLLPLHVPPASAATSEALSEVAAWVEASPDRAGLDSLVSAATGGAAAVSDSLAVYLDQPFVVRSEEGS